MAWIILTAVLFVVEELHVQGSFKKITVRVRLGWKPSFPHPLWERHHPLGSKAQMQRLNGGR